MGLPKYLFTFALIIPCVFMADATKASKSLEVSKAFEKANIVPYILRVAPESRLKITWNTASAELGNTICPIRTVLDPQIAFDTTPGKLYTILLIDPDEPSSAAPALRSYLLELRVNVPASNLNGGYPVAPRVPPTPTPGSGLHRYIKLVYEQRRTIEITNTLLEYNKRINFNVTKFEIEYEFDAPIAGNFYYSEITNEYLKQCKYDKDL